MSIDNIQLPAVTCQMLFEKNLVLNADNEAESSESDNISFIGENQKNILFLVNNAGHKFIADDEMKMLSNLIIACKLSMADIALVNFYHNHFNYSRFSDFFQPNISILFGVSTQDVDLPFTIPHFQIQTFQKQTFLMAPPVSDFFNNKELKKQLWTALQKLFIK